MTVKFQLFDEQEQAAAKVSSLGEVIVAPLSYSEAFYQLIDTADTPFLLVPAEGGKHFILTGIILASTKTFGTATTAETITVYEATPDDIGTNLKTVLKLDLLKNERTLATGINLKLSSSKAIVATATDTFVDITFAGYYIPE